MRSINKGGKSSVSIQKMNLIVFETDIFGQEMSLNTEIGDQGMVIGPGAGEGGGAPV